ncbi:MAG: XTP/dITP diphosphatase [Firmicutes bacterium]|nr:XTP/dITP diphosphatase [Bacillota bacterium]
MAIKLLIATRNKHKKNELEAILAGWEVQVLSLDDIPEIPEVVEDGATFAENAAKKARTTADLSGYVTLADDSGLEVDALGGAPSIFSARFGGPEADDATNNLKLLYLLRDIGPDQRTARFVCVIAVAIPGGEVHTVQGVCEGHIADCGQGQGGFGYDPLFIPQGFSLTFAQLSEAEKNQISHRGQALLQALPYLRTILEAEDQA